MMIFKRVESDSERIRNKAVAIGFHDLVKGIFFILFSENFAEFAEELRF